ncbi:MAG: single-stranded-DNA-specific exonuclease RecJ [Chloroflexi bacterium]|nr:single-stranded-DNA-specific exonuclease RecJ [Chloroflexota bacterium]
MTRWLDPHPVEIPASFLTLGLPPLIAQTLLRRGISSPVEAEAFLHPDATPPTAFPNIEAAVHIVGQAIQQKEKICVWGDFDVDGQTSTALLVQTLRSLGADVIFYIPIRGKESHGVHIESLKPIIDNGAKLIVTCDTGITAHEAVEYASSRGVNVVITDHHDLGETLPNAKAIINPKLLPENHPLKNLAGVGVAYKLAEALLDSGPWTVDGEERSTVYGLSSEDLLDLVALGLIADVALLKGETRSLAQKGILKLRETNRLGLKAIADLSETKLETLTEETIGFTFAPRLNALGRLGDANPAVELLLTKDPARARVLAAQIEGLNSQRRLLTSNVYEAAEAQLRDHPNLLNEPVIVLAHRGWPGGVVGIVANKLVERYHKPAILLNESEDGILRGSARSVEGLHITEAIAAQKEILRGFGGHPMAAGMSFDADKLPEFRKGLSRAIEKQLGQTVREEPSLQIDAWLKLEELNLELASSLEMLAPFGAGNPPLVLASRDVKLKSVSTIGKTKEHLRLNIEDEAGSLQSVLWWGGAGGDLPETETKIDIAYSLRASTFRGQKQVTLQFEEFRIAEEKPLEVRRPKLEIRDMRSQPSLLNLQPSTLIWAEGADRAAGRPRFDLHPADEFSIYTTPPSPAELRQALGVVKPKIVYLFAVSPAEEKPEEFLSHLAGLCKYALNQRRGNVALLELAAAMAARESSVQIGLEWMAAGGQLSVNIEEGRVTLSREQQEKNPYLQAELFTALKGLLNETSAFRKYIASLDAKNLSKMDDML